MHPSQTEAVPSAVEQKSPLVVATMGGEPVQILRVGDGERIEFNQRELERILLADHVKDRPVVVISVAGAYRQGKSFLLSFLLRYLRHKGRSDWMEDTHAPLHGFQWRPGSVRETTGILVWNEVFLMNDPNGEEVAVLLMDTQGTFDSESTMKESTVIFSLSMLTSSVQIYNVMTNIKEDDLQHLQFFAQYGRLAQKGKKTQAFQKLLFLVRDWSWPHEFEFGFRGGRSLIASRLKITRGQASELKTLRQDLLSCFSDIDCFLMPSPGQKVVRDTSFDGRLADISEEFLDELQEFVSSILAPENLLVKEVNGKRLSCEHLMTYFKTYVEVFKGSDLPVPASMLMATANATNVAATDKARQHYISVMKSRPRRDLDRMRQFHREKLAEAKNVFNDYPKMGSDAMSCTFMDVLIKDLEELFDHFMKEEEEIIRKEQEEEAKRERERQLEREREEQRKRERELERQKAEAREAEMKREREAMKEKERKMKEERIREKERAERLERDKEEFNRQMTAMKKKCEDLEKATSGNGADLANAIVNGIANGLSAISNAAATFLTFRTAFRK
ncbi:atlastin-1 isoform X1 [Rhipicephalus microplus]|uniref:atlastin-1 isoform X1 n=1 Tax=Rhipicephalus microplus TaxID=6941 RepID=UPI003F6BF546